MGMKTTELTRKQINSVPCPVCGARKGAACVLQSGALSFDPHQERRLAATAFETKRGKRQPAIAPK